MAPNPCKKKLRSQYARGRNLQSGGEGSRDPERTCSESMGMKIFPRTIGGKKGESERRWGKEGKKGITWFRKKDLISLNKPPERNTRNQNREKRTREEERDKGGKRGTSRENSRGGGRAKTPPDRNTGTPRERKNRPW